MQFFSTKTFGPEAGLTCCWRNWRTDTNCRYLHGYSLTVRMVWSGRLDHRNWVVDFGGLKDIKIWLKQMFDHTTLVARDDPYLDLFEEMAIENVLEIRVVDGVGAEMFAKLIGDYVISWMKATGAYERVKLEEIEVKENGANSAIFKP